MFSHKSFVLFVFFREFFPRGSKLSYSIQNPLQNNTKQNKTPQISNYHLQMDLR